MTKIAIAGGNDNHYLTQTQYNPGAETNLVDYFPLYGLVLLMEETSHQELVDLNGDLPTDTHLVCWMSCDESLRCDAVRAYKKSDIFDCYQDLSLIHI